VYILGQYLITFREVLEAAFIIAIMLSYLIRTHRNKLVRYVWYGVYLAILTSLSLGAFIWFIYGTLTETSRLLFEALAAFLAVIVLSSMIYWMAIKGKYIKQEIEKHIEIVTTKGTIIGLISFAFIIVFREGFETILFLTPFLLDDAIPTFIGMIAGMIAAFILSYSIFIAGMRINLRNFFYLTSILLIFLAGGLASYGVHELLEYYEKTGVHTGWLAEPAYSLNIPEDSLLHHKGIIGSIFAVMFGYSISPEWVRIIVHLIYLAIMLLIIIQVYKKERFKK
jgi:high-affinity iron transporter